MTAFSRNESKTPNSTLMKAEGFHKEVCGSVFQIHFSMNKIMYITNAFNSILG